MAFIFDCKHPILFLCMWCPFLSSFWSGSDITWKNASKGSTSYWWNIDGSLHFCHISVIYRRINTSDKRAVRVFFSSPIMPFTSSHVSVACRTTLFRLHRYQLSSSKFSSSNMRLYLQFMYFSFEDLCCWLSWVIWKCLCMACTQRLVWKHCTFCYF